MMSGRSFTEIATTREWMVTTANLVLLLYPDQVMSSADSLTSRPLTPRTPRRLVNQVRQKKWHIPSLEVECRFNQVDALSMLFGFIRQGRCDGTTRNQRFDTGPLTDEDFSDWRLVTFTRERNLADEDQIPFYDVPRLRNATEITTRLPRIGFFTTSAFFQNWATNVDNQLESPRTKRCSPLPHLTFSH